MIAVDTSTWIAFLQGEGGKDAELLDRALEDRQRAGALRAKVSAKRRKVRLGDALIAQSCIDHGISLRTRDRGFRAFAEAAGLDLPIGTE